MQTQHRAFSISWKMGGDQWAMEGRVLLTRISHAVHLMRQQRQLAHSLPPGNKTTNKRNQRKTAGPGVDIIVVIAQFHLQVHQTWGWTYIIVQCASFGLLQMMLVQDSCNTLLPPVADGVLGAQAVPKAKANHRQSLKWDWCRGGSRNVVGWRWVLLLKIKNEI